MELFPGLHEIFNFRRAGGKEKQPPRARVEIAAEVLVDLLLLMLIASRGDTFSWHGPNNFPRTRR